MGLLFTLVTNVIQEVLCTAHALRGSHVNAMLANRLNRQLLTFGAITPIRLCAAAISKVFIRQTHLG